MDNLEKLLDILSKKLNITFTKADSSNILAYGYDASNLSLWVLFKRNKLYQYMNITKEALDELELSESKGKWVNSNLVKTKKPYKAYEIKIGASS